MSEAKTLALRALALALLAKRVKTADTSNRDRIAAEYGLKSREVVWLPLDGVDVEIGQVRRDKGSTEAIVVDMGALIDWCEQNAPGEVEEYQPAPVTRVRPAYLAALLANAKRDGAAVTTTGEVIPGIDVKQGDPKTVVVPAKTDEAAAALMDQIRNDPNALGALLGELPAVAQPVDDIDYGAA